MIFVRREIITLIKLKCWNRVLEKSKIELRGTDKVVPVIYCSELLGTETFRGEYCKERAYVVLVISKPLWKSLFTHRSSKG